MRLASDGNKTVSEFAVNVETLPAPRAGGKCCAEIEDGEQRR